MLKDERSPIHTLAFLSTYDIYLIIKIVYHEWTSTGKRLVTEYFVFRFKEKKIK